ncbi:MAG: hypothetical protein A3F77_14235 [Betaproteobacteria bacterium RIFCSPLOWO2_12_FULL_67_28]|nr:MAG: hypothetical protein A3F77_14235 [Betaproteobacteria bacterium RIFCSPLOWO2_12_FULL_67_28]
MRLFMVARPPCVEYDELLMTKLGDIAAADPVVARYMQDVDRTLLRRNLALTPEQRLLQLQELVRFAEELRRAGRSARSSSPA